MPYGYYVSIVMKGYNILNHTNEKEREVTPESKRVMVVFNASVELDNYGPAQDL